MSIASLSTKLLIAAGIFAVCSDANSGLETDHLLVHQATGSEGLFRIDRELCGELRRGFFVDFDL